MSMADDDGDEYYYRLGMEKYEDDDQKGNSMPQGDYEKQVIKHIMGNVGADPEQKNGRDESAYVTFRVAVARGYGDDEDARWYSVSVNKPRLQDAVMADIRKGSRVGVEGVPSTREKEGRTYHNFKAFRVGLIDYIGMGEPVKHDRDDDDL